MTVNPGENAVTEACPNTNAAAPGTISLWIMRILCAIALGISGYLAYSAFTQSDVVGCGGDVFDCEHVLTSRFSKILTLPVSVPAFGLYASMLAILAFMRPSTPEPIRRAGWVFLTVGSISAGVAAIWFTGLQKFEIGHYCPWCLAAHGCGLSLALIVLLHRRLTFPRTMQLGSVAFAGVAIMSAVQWFGPQEETAVFVSYDNDQSEALVVESAPGEFGPPVFAAPDEFAPPTFEPPTISPPVFEAPGFSDSEPVLADASCDVPEPVKEQDSGVRQVVLTTADMDSTEIAPAVDPVEQTPAESNADESTIEDPAKTSEEVTTSQTDNKPTMKVSSAAAGWMFFPAGTQSVLQLAFGSDDSNQAESKQDDTKQANQARSKKNLATVPGGKFSLDTRQWPLIGKPEAKYVFVEMFDYTCAHCRITHKAIDGAFDKYGDDLAVIVLPVPLEKACNPAANGNGHVGACELAKIAITVWRIDPAKFRELHDWMCQQSRTTTAARAHAEKLVGADKFKTEYALPHAKAYVQKHVELYQRMGSGTVPKLMFPKAMLSGQVSNKATLINAIERELVKKK